MAANDWQQMVGRVGWSFLEFFENFGNFVAGKQQCLGKNFKLNRSSGKGIGGSFGVARRF